MTVAPDLISWKTLAKMGSVIAMVLSAAWALSSQVALSKAELADHEVRISKVEADDTAKALHDAKRDQQFDDLIEGVRELNQNVAKLSDKIDHAR